MHASTIILGTRGILICGPSGAGKSSLAMALLEQAQSHNEFSALVADDQTLLSGVHGRVIARCPDTLVGKMEIHGLGIASMATVSSAVIDLVVSLKVGRDIERMPEKGRMILEGVGLPHLLVPRQSVQQAMRLITATLAESLDR